MKAEEAAALIRQKFVDGAYLKDPQVTVFIAEYATQNVSVLGEVKNPGHLSSVRRASSSGLHLSGARPDAPRWHTHHHYARSQSQRA